MEQIFKQQLKRNLQTTNEGQTAEQKTPTPEPQTTEKNLNEIGLYITRAGGNQ